MTIVRQLVGEIGGAEDGYFKKAIIGPSSVRLITHENESPQSDLLRL